MDRDKLVEAWKQYGETYNVFVPDDQPMPKGEGWNRPVPEPKETGTVDPQIMKHWRLVSTTRNFLRRRYSEHGILQGPGLTFDCLVPKYQNPLKAFQMNKGRGRGKKKGEPLGWYSVAIGMFVTAAGEVGFTCKSKDCLRTHCKLNLQNPRRMSPVDVYSLIQIFHGYRSVAKAKQIVAEAFDVRLGHFEFRDVQDNPLIKRYAVPKWAIEELIQRYSGMRRQQIPNLVHEAVELVQRSQVVELEHSRVFSNYFAFLWPQIIDNKVLEKINGPAIRLYLWLLVKQEEHARRNDFAMRLSDADVSRALAVSRKTAGIYRQELEKLGLLKVREGIWTVGYTPKSQRNT